MAKRHAVVSSFLVTGTRGSAFARFDRMRSKTPSWRLNSLTAAALSVGLSLFSLATIGLLGRSDRTDGDATAPVTTGDAPVDDAQSSPSATPRLSARSDPYDPYETLRTDRDDLSPEREGPTMDRGVLGEPDASTRVELELQLVSGRDADAGSTNPAPSPNERADGAIDEEGAEPLAAAGDGEVKRQPCGMTVCPSGMVCCNERCGLCLPPGQRCSQLSCSMPMYPVSVACGRNTCSVNEVCCNLSCGICAAPGAPCSQRVCN